MTVPERAQAQDLPLKGDFLRQADKTKTKTKQTALYSAGRPVDGPRGRVTHYYWGRRARRAGLPPQSLELDVTVFDAPTSALVDSGATHLFIAASFVQTCSARTFRAARPLIVTLATGV